MKDTEKYFYDTEFLEGTQDKKFLGVKYGTTKPTIDLISIGVVSEDNIEYYAISKDFNLKEAWNRYDLKQVSGDSRNIYPEGIKVYWIRDNVLKPIWNQLREKEYGGGITRDFSYSNLKWLISEYGKPIEQIKFEILQFTIDKNGTLMSSYLSSKEEYTERLTNFKGKKIELIGYYSSYDHVLLSWMFGKMVNLPKSFPMYTTDVKQILDDKIDRLSGKTIVHFMEDKILPSMDGIGFVKLRKEKEVDYDTMNFEQKLSFTKKENLSYPKESNSHHALADAIFTKELYHFTKEL